MDSRKWYPVQENPYYGIFPGKLQNGNPTIAFVSPYEIVTAYFSQDGFLSRAGVTKWARPKIEPSSNTFQARVEALFSAKATGEKFLGPINLLVQM